MYLISLYFDMETDKTLSSIMANVAGITGNTHMIEGHIPPHITVGMVNSPDEDRVMSIFEKCVTGLSCGDIQIAGIGLFRKSVVYLQPVLNQYIHKISVTVNEAFEGLHAENSRYIPFNWIPHISVAKRLTAEQQIEAIKYLQEVGYPSEALISKIGLAKSNPYIDIHIRNLI